MYRVLIVDDQYFALIGLRQCVDWAALGVEDVRLAENVDQAVDCLNGQAVDLLICDIEMPGKDGLDLLAWAENHSPDTVTIMLTCHADFEYAQRALHHGAFHYLLKPVDYEELKKVAGNALAEVRKKKEQRAFEASMREYRRKWEHQLPLLVERYWQDILSQRTSLDPVSLLRSAETYGLRLHPGDRYALVLLGLEQWKENLSARDEAIMEYAVRNLAGELMLRGVEGVVLQDHAGLNLAIVYERSGGPPVRAALERNGRQLIGECERLLQCSLSVYIGESVPIGQLLGSYADVTEREQRNIHRSRQVFPPAAAPATRSAEQPPAAAPLHLFSEWATMLELGEFEELYRRVGRWLGDCRPEGWTNESQRQFVHGVLFIVHTVLAKKNLSVHASKELRTLTDNDNAPKQFTALKTWTKDCFEAAASLLRANHCTSSAVVTKLRHYIRSRIGEEITREELASHVFLNPAYLSRMFKKETGLSLSDAMIQERLQEAKRMLEETEHKITDIAEKVGYASLGSFSNLFKRVVGVTPQQYRAKNKSGA